MHCNSATNNKKNQSKQSSTRENSEEIKALVESCFMHYYSAYFQTNCFVFSILVPVVPRILARATEIAELVRILHPRKAEMKGLAYARCDEKLSRKKYG